MYANIRQEYKEYVKASKLPSEDEYRQLKRAGSSISYSEYAQRKRSTQPKSYDRFIYDKSTSVPDFKTYGGVTTADMPRHTYYTNSFTSENAPAEQSGEKDEGTHYSDAVKMAAKIVDSIPDINALGAGGGMVKADERRAKELGRAIKEILQSSRLVLAYALIAQVT